MIGKYQIDGGGRAYIPSMETVATAGFAGLGLLTLGPLGLLAGGAFGYMGSAAVGNGYRTTACYIRNGAGSVSYEIKGFFLAAKAKASAAIYFMVSTIPLWLIQTLRNTETVKRAYADTDQAYLAKCRTTVYKTGHSMSLDSLFEALEGGVSSDQGVLNALTAQALAGQEGVSREQVQHRVALGERIYAALSSSEVSELPDGFLLVKDAQGKEIVVESSVYTARALMWYFAAQAIRNKVAQQSVLLMGHFHPTPAEMQMIAKDIMANGKTFVIPDDHHKAFTFLANAKTAYQDRAALFARDSALTGGNEAVKNASASMNMVAIGDSSGYLPGAMERIVINALLPIKGEKGGRLAVKLEDFNRPGLLGQVREGHESSVWHMFQIATGVAAQAAAMVASLKPVKETEVKSTIQVRNTQIHNRIFDCLTKLQGGDDSWAVTHKRAFDKMKQMPLHQLLPYLVHPEQANVGDEDLRVLSRIDETDRNAVKKMIYMTLSDRLQAGKSAEFEGQGEEIFLMPHVIGQAVLRDYWRTQVGKFKENLMEYAFHDIEEGAKIQQRDEYRVTKVARFLWRANSPTQSIELRKKHESDLFDAAYEERIKLVIEENQVRQPKKASKPAEMPTVRIKAPLQIIEDYTPAA